MMVMRLLEFAVLAAGLVAALSGQATTTVGIQRLPRQLLPSITTNTNPRPQRYYDGHKGACGCGPPFSSSGHSWMVC
jgi:hypothetical protein